MSSYPRSPKLVKGALVAYDPSGLIPLPSIIVFQYNPDELSRSFSQKLGRDDADDAPEGKPKQKSEQIAGPPSETINLNVEIDATDQLEVKDPMALSLGIHPTLAALEMLMMPPLTDGELRAALSKAGTAKVGATQLPVVLFVWGMTRVQPVRLTSLSIHETAFDTKLNPIHAQVSLGLKVMNYQELEDSSVGYHVALAMQARREVMARFSLAGAMSTLFGNS